MTNNSNTIYHVRLHIWGQEKSFQDFTCESLVELQTSIEVIFEKMKNEGHKITGTITIKEEIGKHTYESNFCNEDIFEVINDSIKKCVLLFTHPKNVERKENINILIITNSVVTTILTVFAFSIEHPFKYISLAFVSIWPLVILTLAGHIFALIKITSLTIPVRQMVWLTSFSSFLTAYIVNFLEFHLQSYF